MASERHAVFADSAPPDAAPLPPAASPPAGASWMPITLRQPADSLAPFSSRQRIKRPPPGGTPSQKRRTSPRQAAASWAWAGAVVSTNSAPATRHVLLAVIGTSLRSCAVLLAPARAARHAGGRFRGRFC